jgi:phage terminase large subunit GpA
MSADAARVGSLDLLSWSRAYRIEAGGALDFEAFPFQRELYAAFGDPSLKTVEVMKAAQCGISAAGVSLALYAADVWGANVVYVLPGFDVAHDFSDTRVATAIRASAHLRSRVRSTDNKGLKQVGEAFVYFRGSGSEQQALSIPADVLVLDEFDHLDRRHVGLFRRRLGSPTSMKLERAFSNPSYPETGIHAGYLASDQREWLVRCRRCRRESPLTWEGGEDHVVDEDRAALVCGRCGRRLSAEAIATGRWVPGRPDVTPRGYHISRLIVPGQDIGELIAEHRRTDEESVQTHYNFDLGLPYAPRGGSLSSDEVLACRRDYAMPPSFDGPDWVTAGVDVGRVLHVRISRWLPSGKAVPLYIGEIPGFEDLAQLWNRFEVNFGLIDERPEERKAREFMETFRGRCVLIRWSGSEQRDPTVLDSDRGIVSARRTGACDRAVDAFQRQMRLLPRDLPEDYLSQVTAPHRVTETNPRGQKVARYISERADDFFFAEVHDLLAHEVRGQAPAFGSGPPPLTLQEQVLLRRRRRGYGL